MCLLEGFTFICLHVLVSTEVCNHSVQYVSCADGIKVCQKESGVSVNIHAEGNNKLKDNRETLLLYIRLDQGL